VEPNSGVISIGSHNIDDLDLKWWRSQIGLVQQEPFSFNASIYTNVSYGLIGTKWENETEEVKRQLVKEACEESFAAEFIDRLPKVCILRTLKLSSFCHPTNFIGL
jgi:ABC-type multidrug transport system fused ATPase/permease subunit